MEEELDNHEEAQIEERQAEIAVTPLKYQINRVSEVSPQILKLEILWTSSGRITYTLMESMPSSPLHPLLEGISGVSPIYDFENFKILEYESSTVLYSIDHRKEVYRFEYKLQNYREHIIPSSIRVFDKKFQEMEIFYIKDSKNLSVFKKYELDQDEGLLILRSGARITGTTAYFPYQQFLVDQDLATGDVILSDLASPKIEKIISRSELRNDIISSIIYDRESFGLVIGTKSGKILQKSRPISSRWDTQIRVSSSEIIKMQVVPPFSGECNSLTSFLAGTRQGSIYQVQKGSLSANLIFERQGGQGYLTDFVFDRREGKLYLGYHQENTIFVYEVRNSVEKSQERHLLGVGDFEWCLNMEHSLDSNLSLNLDVERKMLFFNTSKGTIMVYSSKEDRNGGDKSNELSLMSIVGGVIDDDDNKSNQREQTTQMEQERKEGEEEEQDQPQQLLPVLSYRIDFEKMVLYIVREDIVEIWAGKGEAGDRGKTWKVKNRVKVRGVQNAFGYDSRSESGLIVRLGNSTLARKAMINKKN